MSSPAPLANATQLECPTTSTGMPPQASDIKHPARTAATLGRSGKQKNEVTPVEDLNKCPTCGSGGGQTRNLVVCIDGTSNQFSHKNTNVVELYSRLVRDKTQLTFYNSGIGTYAKPTFKSWSYIKQVGANKLDLMFALRFEKIIISAYRWLVDNYQEGDRIFMFGFSRGAYQVRALASMLDTVGLLAKGNEDQIPFAYELFAAFDPKQDTSQRPSAAKIRVVTIRNQPSKLGEFTRTVLRRDPPFPRPRGSRPAANASDTTTMQQRFKDTFSHVVKVHYIGAWDTVTSVGFIRGKTLPGTTDGMQNVCFFRHALAMHEYRVKFLPEYVNGGDGPTNDAARGDNPGPPHTKEVWFVGSHSDIGGGSTVNTTLNKFGPALRWMSFEAAVSGLRMKPGPQEWENTTISDSMAWCYKLMEFLPIKRLSYRDKQAVSWLPHLFSPRRIRPNQLIHQTVLTECGTTILALQCDLGLSTSNVQEDDAYTNAQALLSIPRDSTSRHVWFQQLKTLQGSIPGTQSLLDLEHKIWLVLADTARGNLEAWKGLGLLEDALVHRQSNEVVTTTRLSEVLGTGDTDTYWTYPFPLRGHSHPISSVAFLSSKLVVSGSWDRSLRIWNIEIGEAVGDPLTGHTGDVNCVAVSPDGTIVASGSDDATIRTWKFEEGTFIGEGLVIRTDGMRYIHSVAFSVDGLRIVSGSSDRAIRVWDAATGQQIGNAMEGHDGRVLSVAFSPHGARIASGSIDQTARLWDAENFQAIGDPLLGHENWVYSVAFSPADSISVASGSTDDMVRTWNSDTRQPIYTLAGHSDSVLSVAFSPCGRHIASASWDKTIRIWDSATGEPVGVLRGHTSGVWSVAFSPDGTRIASGSDDATVRIWDRIPVLATDST